MVNPNGNKTVLEYSGASILGISVDGFHLKCVSNLTDSTIRSRIRRGIPPEKVFFELSKQVV